MRKSELLLQDMTVNDELDAVEIWAILWSKSVL